jgi:hypothetical protein
VVARPAAPPRPAHNTEAHDHRSPPRCRPCRRHFETYSGLKLLPAVLVLLDVDEDPVVRQAVRITAVQRSGTPPWTEDEITIDWERLQDARRGSTALRMTAIARSMLDDAPVDLREIAHFGHGAHARLMHALATVRPDPPPSIEQLLGADWREVTPDEFRRSTRSEPAEGDEIDRRKLGGDTAN